jgi:hypothetical protein
MTKQLGYVYWDHNSPFKSEKVWFIKCECHRVYVWSFHERSNGCWIVRSIMPLFDTKEVVVVA